MYSIRKENFQHFTKKNINFLFLSSFCESINDIVERYIVAHGGSISMYNDPRNLKNKLNYQKTDQFSI